MKNAYKIYKLVDPMNDKAFYIGKTKQTYLSERLAQHISQTRRKISRNNAPKNKYITSLLEQGVKPRIELIEELGTDRNEAIVKEKYYIDEFNFLYGELTNIQETKNSGTPEYKSNYYFKVRKAIRKQDPWYIKNRTKRKNK